MKYRYTPEEIGELNAEIDQLRSELASADMTLWLVVKSNGGYTIEKCDVESFPVGRASIKRIFDPVTGNTHLSAFTVT